MARFAVEPGSLNTLLGMVAGAIVVFIFFPRVFVAAVCAATLPNAARRTATQSGRQLAGIGLTVAGLRLAVYFLVGL